MTALRAAPEAQGVGQSDGEPTSKSMGTCSVRVATLKLTPTWRLAILPAEPVYWRCTPTEQPPCLRKPVSSMIQVVTASPRALVVARAYLAATRRTAWSSQLARARKWSSLSCVCCMAPTSPQVRGNRLGALALALAEDPEGVHGEGFPLALVPQTGSNLSEIRIEARDSTDVERVAYAPRSHASGCGGKIPRSSGRSTSRGQAAW